MSGKISLALLASASCLCLASEAFAIDASPAAEPGVIYAREPAQPAPVRMASAERSNMGGGFIEFLFGDAPQGGRYQQQPAYQTQPDDGYGGRRMLLPPMDPPAMRRGGGAGGPAPRPLHPQKEKQGVEDHGKENPGTIMTDTPQTTLFRELADR